MQSGVAITMVTLNQKEYRKRLDLFYHHTCDEVPVTLLNEVRIGHTNHMTKEQWIRNTYKE